MLTRRMQIQTVADRLAGLPVQARSQDFEYPWQVCWQAIATALPGQEQVALHTIIAGLPEQKEILEAILATRPGYQPAFRSLEEMGEELLPIEWVWPGWIPRGLLTLLGASQGSGKSFVALDLSWRVIHNKGFPDGACIARPGTNIIYVDAEMVPQILNERAGHYQLDRSRLYLLQPDPGEMIDLGAEKYQNRLVEMTGQLHPELIIIDSLSSVHTHGQNNVEDLRMLIGYLIRLARWADCGLVLVHHIRKPPGGGPRMMNFDLGMEDLSGSGYITQQARVVLGLRVVQTGPEFDPNGPRELKVLKTNLGPYQKPLGFMFAPLHPEGVMLHWDKEAPKTYRAPTRLDECREWLEDLLKQNPDGLKAREVVAMGKEEGFSRDMVFAARKVLAQSIHNTAGHKSPGNRWQWNLSDTDEVDDA